MDGLSLELDTPLPEHLIQALNINEETLFETYFDEKTRCIRLRILDEEEIREIAGSSRGFRTEESGDHDCFECDGVLTIRTRCYGRFCSKH